MESRKNPITVIETKDGSFSLKRSDLNESYHSEYGALSETKLVFIDYGFLYWCNNNPNANPNVLEIGFGSGLNAIATMKFNPAKVYYETIELYPVPVELIQKLNYGKLLSMEKEFETMHLSPWKETVEIDNTFSISKHHTAAQNYDFGSERFDIVYLDAFSPDNEPELWTVDFFKKIYQSCRANAVLTTYCCKGIVKRALKEAGFQIEKLPGPEGKREVLRAIKLI